MTDQQKVREAFATYFYDPSWKKGRPDQMDHWNTWNAAWQAALAHASSASAEECPADARKAFAFDALVAVGHVSQEQANRALDIAETTNPQESSSRLVDAAVLAELTAWLTREMPAGTIIGSPGWWAKRIAGRVHIAIDQAIAGRRGDV